MENNYHSNSELTSDQEDSLEKNLVWIFASPRSGTSWLCMELLSYNIITIDEPFIGIHLAKVGVLEDNPKKNELHKNRKNYFFCNQYKDTWKFYTRKLILNRIYAEFQDLEKKIVIKEPNGSQGADNVMTCLPMSKIIILMRDGRDVVDSTIDSLKEGSWGSVRSGRVRVTSQTKMAKIIRFSRSWKVRTQLFDELYENHHEDLRYKLTYEELLTNTIVELQKIYNFIGVNISNDKLNEIVEKYSFENILKENKGAGKSKRFAKPGKWKENFSDEEKMVFEKIMGNTLREHGYK